MMNRFLVALLAALAGLIALAASAQASWVKPAKSFESYLQPVGVFLFVQNPLYVGGPGDVITTGWIYWGSCAYVFKASLANTSTSMCDLEQGPSGASPGAAVGTLRGSSTGAVDLSAYFPGGVTPTAACAAITGGCIVSQRYDQSDSGNPLNTHSGSAPGFPAIVFSGINGLPVLNFSGTTSLASATSPTLSPANPITYSIVMKRLGNFTTTFPTGIFGASNVTNYIYSGNLVNSVTIGSGSSITGATDNAWNALQGLQTTTSNTSIININGTDNTPVSSNSGNSWSASRIVLGWDTKDALAWIGEVAEEGIISTTTTSTQRGNLCHNQNLRYALSGVSC